MYCKNCGKLLSDDSKYCYHCGTAVTENQHTDESIPKSSQIAANMQVDNIESQDQSPSKISQAIASMALSIGGLFVFFFSIILISMLGADSSSESTLVLIGIIGVLSLLSATAAELIAMILGIKSIKHFVSVKKNCGKKHISTLVFGIVGCSIGGFMTFYCSVLLLVCLAGISV